MLYLWSRLDVDEGLGMARLEPGDPITAYGHEVVLDGGVAWSARFRVELDASWHTRRARVVVVDEAGERELTLNADGEGGWIRDGAPASDLEGCLDVDIAATPLTNTFAIRRLGLGVGESADIRAVWVGAPELEVEPLGQTYRRLEARDGLDRYEYRVGRSPEGRLIQVDEYGVALDYEGFARRVHF